MAEENRRRPPVSPLSPPGTRSTSPALAIRSRPEGQEGSMSESARDALDSFDEAMVWDDESKLELACRFIDEQGLFDEFKAFLREQAENEANDGN